MIFAFNYIKKQLKIKERRLDNYENNQWRAHRNIVHSIEDVSYSINSANKPKPIQLSRIELDALIQKQVDTIKNCMFLQTHNVDINILNKIIKNAEIGLTDLLQQKNEAFKFYTK